MAYNVRTINTLDLKPSTGVGVALPFNSPSVFKSVYTTKEQLKYNIINFLLTDQRERVFDPTFGAGIRRRLFEQITQESNEALEASIRTAVENRFPAVRVVRVAVFSDTDSNLINVQFSYRVLSTLDEDEIILTLQNG